MTDLVAATIVVFVAELGDKTQLVALGFGARHRLGPVLIGVALGYLASITVGVVIGGVLGAALPERAIALGGGVLFILFASWTLWSERDLVLGRRDEEPVAPQAAPANEHPRLVLSIASMMFVAELGDKTMVASATLAASGNAAAVWVGATIGIIAAGFVGVVVGRALGDRLPERAIAVGSAVMFALFGVALIALTVW
jgi:putative Ca2+/H+ antiporter (TMEM165/GDT1 family)